MLDDYRDRRLMIAVSDAGAVLHDWLKSDGVSEILFGAGTGPHYGQIIGTIDPDSITHVAETNTTTIPVSIASANKENVRPDYYEYHVVSVDAAAKRSVELQGAFTLLPRRV
ncbi:MAG: hypothetical protein KDA91_21005 [Planctomycetaceae bacterium]|nr:hypothetical protein [Planctomycetaceae bacterium]